MVSNVERLTNENLEAEETDMTINKKVVKKYIEFYRDFFKVFLWNKKGS